MRLSWSPRKGGKQDKDAAEENDRRPRGAARNHQIAATKRDHCQGGSPSSEKDHGKDYDEFYPAHRILPDQ